MELIEILVLTLIASIIGAVPLGLVNLKVLEVSYKNGLSAAMKVATGASVVEILFVLIALFSGGIISVAIGNFNWLKWVFVLIPIAIGVYYLQKRNHFNAELNRNSNSYIKGAILNLVSVQVLLFWIFSIAFISTRRYLHADVITALTLAVSVLVGKMTTLWIYALASKTVLERFSFLSVRINKVIGFVLIVIGIVQYLKF
jgi:threonine/homoserine/homoserine lactone efflux protein